MYGLVGVHFCKTTECCDGECSCSTERGPILIAMLSRKLIDINNSWNQFSRFEVQVWLITLGLCFSCWCNTRFGRSFAVMDNIVVIKFQRGRCQSGRFSNRRISKWRISKAWSYIWLEKNPTKAVVAGRRPRRFVVKKCLRGKLA